MKPIRTAADMLLLATMGFVAVAVALPAHLYVLRELTKRP